MSICTRIIVSVAFHKVDYTPYTKTCSKCDYQCLQYSYCAVKKCHNSLSSCLFFEFCYGCPAITGSILVTVFLLRTNR